MDSNAERGSVKTAGPETILVALIASARHVPPHARLQGQFGLEILHLIASNRSGKAASRRLVDATYLKAHRTTSSLRRKGLIGRTKGSMNTKLHALADTDGRLLKFFKTAGRVSDHTGTRALLSSPPSKE